MGQHSKTGGLGLPEKERLDTTGVSLAGRRRGSSGASALGLPNVAVAANRESFRFPHRILSP